MKHLLARTSVVVGLTTALLTPAMPAQAAGGITFTADIVMDGFGNGESYGEAWLCVNGVVNGAVVATASTCDSIRGHAGYNAHATFTLYQDRATCPATGSAIGSVTGAVVTDFYWTRMGATATITVSGGNLGTGGGGAAFLVTNPIGNPCTVTGPVRASAQGSVAGV